MLGWRSPVHVVTSLTMLGLSLFAVTTARAQTPNVAVDGTSARRPVVEATAPKTTEPTEAKASEPATKTDAAAAKADATPATCYRTVLKRGYRAHLQDDIRDFPPARHDGSASGSEWL